MLRSNQQSGCGLITDDSDPTYLDFVGSVTINYLDDVIVVDSTRPLYFTRSSTSTISYTVRFQKSVSVSTEDTIYADPRILSAVIKQDYTTLYGGSLNIGLITDLQNPFEVKSVVDVATPPNIIATAVEGSACEDTDDCLQQWSFTLLRTGTCYFDGTYTAHVAIACQNSTTDCPINGTQLATVSFSLNSGDVCSSVQITYPLNATLTSYLTTTNKHKQSSWQDFTLSKKSLEIT
jgi:hypothetical protein